jgi:zinc protease
MIRFEKFALTNGLKVIVHEDKSTPMIALNIVYNVGSKNEDANKTGFAHLFEHLMFGGSKNIPDFDGPIQDAGGENNAFTNADLTNFYEVLPAQNIETALWLESDRMLELRFSKKSLNTQKKVVVEEFKETCLNEPYGDMWHHLSRLAYHTHPYQWPTIGKEIQHIKDASLDEVEKFFYQYYRPENAVLVLAGNITVDHAYFMVNKWFGDIPRGDFQRLAIPKELPQQAFRQEILHRQVPLEALFQAFHMGDRLSTEFYACDLMSDVLAEGRSSRFYQRLYKDKGLFSSIDAFVSGSIDPGLFVVAGKSMPGVTMDHAKAAIQQELDLLKTELISEKELTKLKNCVESHLVFEEISILNKAISLAYFEILGDAEMINTEAEKYLTITAEDIRHVAEKIFHVDNCSELIYFPLAER